MDRGDWQAIVHEVTDSDMTEYTSHTHTHTHTHTHRARRRPELDILKVLENP